MAHEVETMGYVTKKPWHGLGTDIPASEGFDADTFQARCGLDWMAEKVPLMTVDSMETVGHYAVRRTTDGRILGTVGARYRIVQNSEAFDWFRPFLDSQEASLETAGSLRNGSRIWVLAKLAKVAPMEITKGDMVEKYLLLSHSHDGSLAVRCGFTPVRVVCANTMAMAHGNSNSQLIRIKHSASVLKNLENVRDIVKVADAAFEATAEQLRRLATHSVSQQDLRKYVKTVFGFGDIADERIWGHFATDKAVSERSKNIMDRVLQLAETGRGIELPGVRGTLWGAYNAVSEYLGYEAGRTQSSRLESLWYGAAANTNRHALDLALQMAS